MPVYFIQCEDANKYIKIGYTQGDPQERLEKLQVGCPYPMTLLGVVDSGRKVERELHRKYDSHRVRGEWFRPDMNILQFIEKRARLQNANAFVDHLSFLPEEYQRFCDKEPRLLDLVKGLV